MIWRHMWRATNAATATGDPTGVTGAHTLDGISAGLDRGHGQGRVGCRLARRHRRGVESGAHREDAVGRDDGTGQYSIEDLRPGTYTVTFTLQGFTTVKREGIELTGSFIATVNADLKVGGVAETITVSGEAPIVDVTSTRNQQVISGQTVAEIPSSRQYSALTHLIPAINVQRNDFAGSNPALYSVFQIHGGRRNEGQVLVDGMNGGYQGMGVSGYVPEVGNAQEVVFSLSGGLGEATTGGPQMNIIGKQGGNIFAGSFFVSGTGSSLQGNNLTPEVQAKGLTAGTQSRSCGTSTLRSAARSSVTSCGSSARTAIRSAGRMSPACGSTGTRATPRNGPTTRS